MISLWTIFTTMVSAGLSAVGGAWGTVAAAQSAWVRPGLLTPDQFTWALSVGQITPGPLSVLVVALGWQLRRLSGAAVAVAGILLPTWVVCAVAGRALGRYRRAVVPYTVALPWIIAALAGTSGLRMLMPIGLHWWEAAVVAAAALLVVVKRVEPLWILGVSALVGGAFSFFTI